jgi:nucleoside-diphosphate-sugar epimerase
MDRADVGASQRILITGAAGNMGTLLRPRLRKDGRTLRLLDLTAPPSIDGEDDSAEIVTGSVTDPEVMRLACRDVDVILHLGGLAREDTWERISEVNITGTKTTLEAAVATGVRRIVLASSNHVVGFRALTKDGDDADGGLPAESAARPDSYYGVSKAAMEALGSLYHSRFGIDVICVRIGICFERPWDQRGLGLWLSPDDAGRLFEACIAAPAPGFRVIWGVSHNTRRRVSLDEAAELGYRSLDDAERFAGSIPEQGPGTGEEPSADYVGGPWLSNPLGQPNPL